MFGFAKLWSCPCLLQSNNEIVLPTFTHRVPPSVKLNSDNAEDVQRKALDHFKASTFTSYTEFRLEDPVILLVLRNKANTGGKIVMKYFFEYMP